MQVLHKAIRLCYQIFWKRLLPLVATEDEKDPMDPNYSHTVSCPICQHSAIKRPQLVSDDDLDCSACGCIRITGTAASGLQADNDLLADFDRSAFSGRLRALQHSDHRLVVTSDTLDFLRGPVQLILNGNLPGSSASHRPDVPVPFDLVGEALAAYVGYPPEKQVLVFGLNSGTGMRLYSSAMLDDKAEAWKRYNSIQSRNARYIPLRQET